MMDRIKFFFITLACMAFTVNSSSFSNDGFDDFEDFSAFESEFSKSKTQVYDPLESWNRKVFYFNEKADKYIIGNVVKLYRLVTPKFLRTGVSNFFNNITSPLSAANSALQGKLDNSRNTLSAFIINSTVGIFGFIDVASREKVFYKKEDFGQTLASYGIGQGPYLVLPFLGPSTARALSGMVADRVSSPTSVDYFGIRDSLDVNINNSDIVAVNALDIINTREALGDMLDETRSTSLDYYVTIRSYYLQNRKLKINE